jgi:hypothetical protein
MTEILLKVVLKFNIRIQQTDDIYFAFTGRPLIPLNIYGVVVAVIVW